MFKWTFPDQAISRNLYGIGKLKPVPIPKEPIMGQHDAVHSNWRSDAHREALSRVRNTKKADEGMLGKLKMNERSQRYERPMSRSAVPNGVFHGSPMEYVTSAGLRGGVITSKEGREWLQKRLNNRIVELDAIGSRDFSAGAPPKIALTPQFDVLNATLQNVFNDFDSGNFVLSNAILENLQKVESELLKAGSYITGRELDTYSTGIQKLFVKMNSYTPEQIDRLYIANSQTAREVRRRVISIKSSIKTMIYFLKEIARSVNWSKPEREQLMNSLREKKLGETISASEEQALPLPQGALPQPIAPVPAPAPAPAPVGQGKRFRLRF
jgi:hypothetical protein